MRTVSTGAKRTDYYSPLEQRPSGKSGSVSWGFMKPCAQRAGGSISDGDGMREPRAACPPLLRTRAAGLRPAPGPQRQELEDDRDGQSEGCRAAGLQAPRQARPGWSRRRCHVRRA